MILTLILAATGAAQPVPAARFPIFGMANASCQEWTTMKSDKNLRAAQAGFVAGVLTGANLIARRNVTGESNRDRLLARIDRECSKNAFRGAKVVDVLKALFTARPAHK